MQFKQLLIGVTATLAFSAQSLASSFGVPERPTNITPSNGESSVSVTPTLTSSEFVIKDDDGNVLENTALTESEWLVYQDTGVTLVGGTNLSGADRAYGETIYFDVSSSNLSLSGSSVQYAYVNHKRLELTDSSHSLLGYVELPEFIWQAENKDQYLAVRFKQFADAVVIEWSYGDDTADTPWNLRLQAVLNNQLIGVKIDSMDLTSEFNSSYGNEGINFCDESECFNHSFSELYVVSGNAYTCSLMSLADSCELANRYSNAPLDDMTISQVAYGTSGSNNFTLSEALTEVSQYYWTVRHKGTLNSGSEISGGWSNATMFTTQMLEVPEVSASVISYGVEELIRTRDVEVNLLIKNNSNIDVSNFIITVDPYPMTLDDISEFPSYCSKEIDEYALTCTIQQVISDEEIPLSFLINVSDSGDFTATVLIDIDGDRVYTSDLNFGEIRGLEEAASIDISGTFDKLEYQEGDLATANISISQSAVPLGEDSVVIYSSFSDFSLGESTYCRVISEYSSSSNTQKVMECSLFGRLNNGPLTNFVQFPDLKQGMPNLSIEVCDKPRSDEGYCKQRVAIKTIYAITNPKEEGGSSLWFIPLLGFLVRRKKLH